MCLKDSRIMTEKNLCQDKPETIFSLAPTEGGKQFCELLASLRNIPGKKRLKLTSGRYLFRKKDATALRLPVSNTVVFGNDPVKHIGVFLDNLDNLVIEGGGAEFLFDGDMTAIVMQNCRHVRLENITIDYIRPRISEMTVLRTEENSADFAIHPDSEYSTDDCGRFCWVNADGIKEALPSHQIVQCMAPDRSSNLRTVIDPIRTASSFEMLDTRTVRFHYPEKVAFHAGETYQFRNPSRNEEGIVLDRCEDVIFDGLHLNFTPGLGIVAQMCQNLSILHHRHAPASGSGRVCAAFADCIQISSCRGNVVVADSFFSGAQDDPINVHGTYLGVESINGREVLLKFRQQETWGFLPFDVGDEICFVRARDLNRMNYYRVKTARQLDDFQVSLTLDSPVDGTVIPADFVVENMSAYPDISIHDCIFECYPTRGILMSSAGKCRIYNNEIRQTAARPAILIAGDANSWYESGGVRDVKIFRNHIRFCRNAAIEICPQVDGQTEVPVHRNIEIRDNVFEKCSPVTVKYRATADLRTDLPDGAVRPI